MSKIKECFTSRYDNGAIVEVDYSQLEIACLAFLSQDKKLKEDITDGRDLHLVSLSHISGEDYPLLKARYDRGCKVTAARRKLAKAPSFQLQYGAGPKAIAASNGWTMQEAKDYIANYYKRYPGVKEWQDNVRAVVEANQHTDLGWVKPGNKWGVYVCPYTKRKYIFLYDEKYKGFSPTQMKNYPVQGFATADLVPTVLGRIVKHDLYKHNRNNFLLINTIHDSILFDLNLNGGGAKTVFEALINETVGKTKEIMKDAYGIDIDVPLRYDVNMYSHSWGGQTVGFSV